MTKQALFRLIIDDLGANYDENDGDVVGALLDETISSALFVSNRICYADELEKQLDVLGPEIRRAVKSVYLQRGSEDTVSASQLGISASFDDAMARMRGDIIKGNKRILI